MQDVYDRVTLEGRFCFGVDGSIPRFALRHGFLSSEAIVFFSPPDITKPVLMTPNCEVRKKLERDRESMDLITLHSSRVCPPRNCERLSVRVSRLRTS